MKPAPDCLACIFTQALNTARHATGDESLQSEILRQVAEMARRLDPADFPNPSRLSQPVYAIVSQVTGVSDPYVEAKRRTNEAALALLPRLLETARAAADPLETALLIAAAGNIMDFGIGHAFELEKDIPAIMEQGFAAHSQQRFGQELRPGARALYLGDNAGEIALDQVLVRLLLEAGVQVTYSVKSAPIINDATMQDARETGLTGLVPVIETGSGDIGVNWEAASAEFRRAFETADVIISKGQGNFETLSDRPANIYFLLKAKCPLVARALGVGYAQAVFLSQADLPGNRAR